MRRLTLLILIALPLPAISQTEDWSCSSCPSTYGWLYDIDLGAALSNDENFRFGNQTGLDNDDTEIFGDFYSRFRNDNANYLLLDGYLRGVDAFGLFIRGGMQSRLQFRATYQAVPIRQFDTTRTPYFSSNRQVLPGNWVRASTTAGMTALDDTLRAEPIARDLDILKLGVRYQPTSAWDVNVDYRYREQNGSSRRGLSFLFNTAEFVVPVNDDVSNLDASIAYNASNWQLRLAYFGSTYSNAVGQFDWDNAYSVPFGVTAGQAATAPDNDAHNVSLNAALRLPSRTTITASVARGRLEQDATLLDYTVNSALPVNPLPVTSADTRVDTTNILFRLNSKPSRKISVRAEYLYNEHDNRTARNQYDVILTDSAPGGSVFNPIYDYERERWSLRADYRPWRNIALAGGVSSRDDTRSEQDRRETSTDRGWLELRTRLQGVASLKAEVYSEDRDGSEYGAPGNSINIQNPLMRKYNLADRDRDGYRIRAALLAFSRFDFGIEYADEEDKYRESSIGLSETSSERTSIDASWVDGRTTLYASASQDRYKNQQRNSQSFSAPDWAATTADRFRTGTLGWTQRQLFDLVDVELEYSLSRSRGRISNNTSGLLTQFPDLRGRRETARLGLRAPITADWSLGIDYFYEEVTNDDWALDGVLPDTVPGLLALGAETWNYDNNVFYLSFRYSRDQISR